MTWRLAKSLEKLREQVNAMAPHRDKSSDGTIGDTRHQATKSEHNPDANGVVRALDITNDPTGGLDAGKLAETLRLAKDPRVLYIISRGRIVSSRVSPWQWRPYHGVNGHFHHVHVSVVESKALYDNVDPWHITEQIHKPAQATVTAKGGLNLRGGASLGFPTLKLLPFGTTVNLGVEIGDWVQVDVDGDGSFDGYCYKPFLK